MPEMTSYPPGTPSWVDLATTETAAAQNFYRQVLGWDFEQGGAESGGYVMCRLRDRNVAGIFQLMPEQLAQGVPPNWTTYIATDDADAAAKRIIAAGGIVLMGPMDVMEEGRLVVVRDPTGAVFGLWQGRRHTGAELVNEPSTVTWNEAVTPDVERARRFYTEVFDYTTEPVETGDGPQYLVLKVADRPVGGLMEMAPGMASAVPPHWMTYFAVTSTDEAIQAAQQSGGQLRFGPMDSTYGRFAVLQDPQGAVFSVIEVSTES